MGAAPCTEHRVHDISPVDAVPCTDCFFYFSCLCLSLRLFQFYGYVTFYFDIVWWTKLAIHQLMNARETPAYCIIILYAVLCVVCWQVCCVKRYCGSRVSLTAASRLVLGIADVDNYQLLLDGLQLRCDFRHSCERLQAELDAKLDCCNAILKSVSLRRFAHLMLQVGNILNEVACSVILICCTVTSELYCISADVESTVE